MLALYMLWPCVCLSVRLSQAGIVRKWLNVDHAPGRGANYCSERVCMFVCLSALIISKITCPNLTKFLYNLHVAMARSSSDNIAVCYTSGFVDDVMFLHNGANTDRGH